MTRRHRDWITAYMHYAKHSEAPRRMHFWTAVSAIAGALRRKVWIDQAYFKWYPNFYICLVAPPGIVSKSTTADVGIRLLRKVPEIVFGPDIVTWPSLVETFAKSTIGFEFEGAYHPMSAMTLESSEFGNLLNPQDKEMVDLLVSLWDGKQGSFQKTTKTSGNDAIENPWINLIACTTPSWIAMNFPEYMVGGGLTSRMIFVYADKKEKRVAYPKLVVPADLASQATILVDDLTEISKLVGEFIMTPEAYSWGKRWYDDHYDKAHAHLDKERFGGYLARKQTHIHKLAMVLSASEGDSMQITHEHLQLANQMVTDLEPDMQFVFSKIGRSDVTVYLEKLIQKVHATGGMSYKEGYQYVHSYFPSMRDFEDVFAGAIRAGYVDCRQRGSEIWMIPGPNKLPSPEGEAAAT